MLFNVLKRMIEREQTDGLREKIDVFYAVGSLSETEYTELARMLDGGDEQ